jgi:hypothetical protein
LYHTKDDKNDGAEKEMMTGCAPAFQRNLRKEKGSSQVEKQMLTPGYCLSNLKKKMAPLKN